MKDLKEWDGKTPPAHPPLLAPVDKAIARTVAAIMALFAAALVALTLLVAALGVYRAPIDDMKTRPEVGKQNFWAQQEGRALGHLDMSSRAVEEGALCAQQEAQCEEVTK